MARIACGWAMRISLAWVALALAPARTNAGLIALYQFDNPSNLGEDTSGDGNNATNLGATYSSAGYEGGAAYFSGSTYIQSPLNVSTTAQPDLTWGAWVMPTQLSPLPETVLSIDTGGFQREIDIDDRDLSGNYVSTTSWSAFTGSGVLASNVVPSTSSWTFVAAVYNQSAGSLTFYVNGESFTASTAFATGQTFFDIGRNPDYYSVNGYQSFVGYVDNVFVYNQALSASQIAAIEENGFPAVPEPSTLLLVSIAFSLMPFAVLVRRLSTSE